MAEETDKAAQFERFKADVVQIIGDDFVGTVGPADGQCGFATNEPACKPHEKAKYIDRLMEAKGKYPALARCAIMPFDVSGRTVYCMAGLRGMQ